jgi:hypothetical protein
MAKEKTTGFYFKMSPEEAELFERRMEQTGIRNKSAFIRKMCIDGHVFKINMEQIGAISRMLRVTANNMNQLARRVNSGGEAHREDIAEASRQLTEIRSEFGEVLNLLSDVANPKPGKRFIPPPTIRDLPEYQEAQAKVEGA